MGSKINKSEQNDENNSITLNGNGIIEFVKQKINNFRNKKRILSILRIYLNSPNNNKLTEPYKWTNYKENKYTEKGIEIFSFELTKLNNNDFRLDYYFYYGYYLKYYNFNFENEHDEKNFRDNVMSIDENFNLDKNYNKPKDNIIINVSEKVNNITDRNMIDDE